MAMMVFGLRFAWLADFDAWSAWSVPSREHGAGIVLIGLGIGGLASVRGGLLGYVRGAARKSPTRPRQRARPRPPTPPPDGSAELQAGLWRPGLLGRFRSTFARVRHSAHNQEGSDRG